MKKLGLFSLVGITSVVLTHAGWARGGGGGGHGGGFGGGHFGGGGGFHSAGGQAHMSPGARFSFGARPVHGRRRGQAVVRRAVEAGVARHHELVDAVIAHRISPRPHAPDRPVRERD